MTADGYHLNNLGCYIAGLTVFGTVTGQDIIKIDYIPSQFTNTHLAVSVESVLNALKTPYSVTKSQYNITTTV